jgi:hypothetical protein
MRPTNGYPAQAFRGKLGRRQAREQENEGQAKQKREHYPAPADFYADHGFIGSLKSRSEEHYFTITAMFELNGPSLMPVWTTLIER